MIVRPGVWFLDNTFLTSQLDRLCKQLPYGTNQPVWGTQVSIHVAASHKASQHQTLMSQIQIVGSMPYLHNKVDRKRWGWH